VTSAMLESYRRAEGWLGRTIDYRARVDSTNDQLMAAGEAGAAEGTVIVADVQTAGRGRLDRKWHAPVGTCLLLSMLFRPPQPFARYASRTTMACGLAVLDAVQEVTGLRLVLKWPNDVIVEDEQEPQGWAKVAGLLSEIGLRSGVPAFLGVGVGLNVNLPRAYLVDLAPGATSLLALAGYPVSRVRLLDRLLAVTERRYDALRAGDEDPFEAWRASLAWLGDPVIVRTPTGVVRGIAEDVDVQGRLQVRAPDGQRHTFSAGDVSLRRPTGPSPPGWDEDE
jgi:BirA family transcriptional regulator, biotin operon repressor / biotin---[acetyl-CoA-carboxylase] ligase